MFEQPDCVVDSAAGILLLILCGGIVPKNPPLKFLAKSFKTYTTIIPGTDLLIGQSNTMNCQSISLP